MMGSRREFPSLTRRKSKFNPKKKFILCCEGKNTEPLYFESIRNFFKNSLIAIQNHRDLGSPDLIADFAARKARELKIKKKTDSMAQHDEIWVLFDKDNFDCFFDAIKKCEQIGVKVACSVPCFELWLALHFGEYERPCVSSEIQKHLESLCEEYKKSKGKTIKFEKILHKIEDAERRAEKMIRRQEEEGFARFSSPYTSVFNLTRAIRQSNFNQT